MGVQKGFEVRSLDEDFPPLPLAANPQVGEAPLVAELVQQAHRQRVQLARLPGCQEIFGHDQFSSDASDSMRTHCSPLGSASTAYLIRAVCSAALSMYRGRAFPATTWDRSHSWMILVRWC